MALTKIKTSNLETSIDLTGINDTATSQILTVSDTGIDVTGTVTADGLTVENNTTDVKGTVKNTLTSGVRTATLDILPQNDGDYGVSIQASGGDGTGTFQFNNKNIMKFDFSNDISFYEDTGTTAKFFWDASTERLGLGTSSPSYPLHISNAGTNELFLLEATGSGAARLYFKNTAMTTAGDTQIWSQNNDLAFNTSGSERMRIDSSGNVDIKTGGANLKLAYSSSDSYSANLGWQHLQLGNNGDNYIVGGNTNTGGKLIFVVNNTTDLSTNNAPSHNGTEAMRIDSNCGVEFPHKQDNIDARMKILSPVWFGGMWHYYYLTSGGPSSTTNKILRMNTWYWGAGGCFLEIHRSLYTSFNDHSIYALRGHTNGNNNNPGVTTLLNNGGPVPYFASTIFESTGNTTNDGSNSQGYADLLIDRGGYNEYHIVIKSYNHLYRLTSSSGGGHSWGANRIWVYPNGTT